MKKNTVEGFTESEFSGGMSNGTGNGVIARFALLLLLVLIAGLAAANPLPSAMSGTYQGSGDTAGWTCEFRAFQVFDGLGGSMRALSADCQAPTGHSSGAATTSDACPTEITQPFLVSASTCGPAPLYCTPVGTPKISVLSYAASTPQCALGAITVQRTASIALSPNAPGTLVGSPSTMCRTQIVVPTNSYPGCNVAEPVKVKPPRIRGL